MTRTQTLALGVVVVLGSALLWSALPRSASHPPPPQLQTTARITVDGVPLSVAIADTSFLRQNGLSGYAPLKDREGMLFVFEEEGLHSFWMKDMLFSIDMLWINAEGRVVHIEREVSPETFPTSFTSDSPARYVLEVPAGLCDMLQFHIGSEVILP